MVGNKKRVISSLAIVAGIVTTFAWALNRKRRRKHQLQVELISPCRTDIVSIRHAKSTIHSSGNNTVNIHG